MKTLLIAGCGDLGKRLAGRLDATEWHITGLRRDIRHLPEGMQAVAGDLTRPETLAKLDRHYDAVVYQATPNAREPAAYREIYVAGLARLLSRVSTDRLILVSSTAVYGQDDGSQVDEDSPTEPQAFNGRILLEAEQLAIAAGGLVVRFSGIYGPGRDFLLRQLRSGQAVCRDHPPQWTNRVHIDDCAAVLAHLLKLDRPESIYCASDPTPSRRCEVLDWLADQLGVARPARTDTRDSGAGKRVLNHRLVESGFDFTYPDFRAGYPGVIHAPAND